jgi:hypothetical protein
MTRAYPTRCEMIDALSVLSIEDRDCLETWTAGAVRRLWWDWCGGPALAARLYPVQWAEWLARADRGECCATWHDFRWYYRLPAVA